MAKPKSKSKSKPKSKSKSAAAPADRQEEDATIRCPLAPQNNTHIVFVRKGKKVGGALVCNLDDSLRLTAVNPPKVAPA
jgi:hypothetical protein